LTALSVSENQPDTESTDPSKSKRSYSVDRISLVGLASIAFLTVFIYHGVIQNIFHSDDYAHIRWAYQAMNHPQMVLQDFVTSWAGCLSVPFYRPLSSVFIFVDYLIWGNNGFGFHLTNIALHIATSVVVWALAKEFGDEIVLTEQRETGKQGGVDRRSRVWALAAAGLFAVYPLHPEAVSWMIGRVDLLATFFCVCAFWLFIRWRHTQQRLPFVLALVSFACSLCSKETGVTLPAVLLAYSFLIPSGRVISSKLLSSVKETLPFWIALGLYLLVRVYALKTVIGGYGNVLPALVELRILLKVWLASVYVLFSPYNVNLLTPNDFVVRLWQACGVICGAATLIRFARNASSARFGVFLMAWMLIALLPVLKYFVLTPELQGGRMAYMCCIPLCLILTHGIAFTFDASRPGSAGVPQALTFNPRHLTIAVAVIYIASGAFLTFKNNEPWKRAGEEMRAVHEALNNQYKSFPAGKFLYFAGVPDQIQGAYSGVNAMEALFQRPQMQQDIQLCCSLAPADLFEPYGYIRNTLLTTGACRLYTWHSKDHTFQTFVPSQGGATRAPRIWNDRQLATLLVPNSAAAGPAISPTKRTNRFEFDFSRQGLNCWDAEFLQLKLQVVRPRQWHADNRLTLSFKNDLQAGANSNSSIPLTVQPGEDIQSVIVPLHSNVIWSLGGECKSLCFEFPDDWKLRVLEIAIRDNKRLLPSIEVGPKTPSTSLGIVWSSQVGPRFYVAYDVSAIDKASRAQLEITKPNIFFLHQNAAGPAVEAGSIAVFEGVRGRMALDTKDFLPGAIYEMRVRALDSRGNTVGFASDHIAFIK
jgi:hypothetical protein